MNRNYKVYVHINKVNGKRYYGITCQKVERRWQNGKAYKDNKHFTRAINKYGWDNFEHIVLFDNLTKAEAELMEKFYIALYDTINQYKGYNISLGGDTGIKHSEETKKKLSESHKGENNPMYGKNPWNKGKTHSEETRKKLSEANKGKNNPNYGRKGEKHPMYGKNHSEESRKKISETMKGRTFSEEHKKHLSESRKGKTLSEETRKKLSEAHKGKYKGKNSPSAKRIYCVELDKYFDSIVEASEILGCNRSSISMVLRGKRKKAGGYHWLYAEDVEKIEIENNKVS